jgi:hypothetical protein
MESYSKNTAETYQLTGNNDWLRQRQGLALPVLPPTTLEARKYFFSQAHRFAAIASAAHVIVKNIHSLSKTALQKDL